MDVHAGYGASPFPRVRKTRQGPLPVPHPRRRLTAVTDDEQLEEVIVVPGHAGSWWLTPALCRVFARFAVRPPRLANKIPAAGSQERKPRVALLGTVSPPEPAAFFSGFRGVSNTLPPLQTAGNSASFAAGAAPNSDPELSAHAPATAQASRLIEEHQSSAGRLLFQRQHQRRPTVPRSEY